ncbi:ribonuclease T2 family protein [Aurantiacibacter aquimixticola]|uniref:Ribonuclease T n=1 Tax=Aurantiacibacter aquimixticola TaxID=1958945 RepID=A0A419RWY8_9SPHN|nr:ribonuclease T [Aurantiacibacter aquimixticola]RJY10315.1 ribonuclease T [Aurantiacibacter aquimixticola]
MRRMKLAGLATGLALLAMPVQSMAQAYQCRVPQGGISIPDIQRDGPVRQTRVTGYTLALSWSPEFCRFREDSARHARQCSGRAGRFAFVVHGLWPDGPGGRWPQWCPTRERVEPAEARGALCMQPDTALIARQWAKHGSCMTRQPGTYLRVTQILWESLRWPDFDRLSRRDGLTAGDIRTTFAEANPYWDAEDVGLVVNERGWLREMRLCYGADFMPRACDARRYGPDDDAEVRIWRGM